VHRRWRGLSPQFCSIKLTQEAIAAVPQTANLNGACLETLAGWEGDYLVSLDRGISLAPRFKNQDEVALLVRNALREENCPANGHMIVAVLALPSIPSDQFIAFNFDCFDARQSVKKGDAIVGVFQTSARTLPVKAVRAWLANIATSRFDSVAGVACRSFQ
jgi:hypothetical protein